MDANEVYQLEVLLWRQSLSTSVVRDMAAEWRAGSNDPACLDAALESEVRWPNGHVARRLRKMRSLHQQGAQGSTLDDAMRDHALTA